MTRLALLLAVLVLIACARVGLVFARHTGRHTAKALKAGAV